MTDSPYLFDLVEQWLKDDEPHWSIIQTNRAWIVCKCITKLPGMPAICIWADCIQVIVVSGYKSYDIMPEDPEFFAKLKTVLSHRCNSPYMNILKANLLH